MYTSFLLLPGSYDDDPGSKRDAERARYLKDPESKGQNTTQTLNRSKTLKEHCTRKTLNPSGLVSANATLFMLKQEEQLKGLNILHGRAKRKPNPSRLAASRDENEPTILRAINLRTNVCDRTISLRTRD